MRLSRALVVCALVVCALFALADGRRSLSATHRFRAYLKSRTTVTYANVNELMSELANNPFSKWTLQGHGREALAVLRSMFEADAGSYASEAAFRTKINALGDPHNAHAIVANADLTSLYNWLTALRAFAAPIGGAVANEPKIYIKGGGPSGLAAALYARARARAAAADVPAIIGVPARRVLVAEKRSAYTRTHMVTIRNVVPFIAGSGMQYLFTSIGAAHLRTWFPYHVHDATQSVVMTAVLEKILSLSARVIGVEFVTPGPPAEAPAGSSTKAQLLAGLAIADNIAAEDWQGHADCAAPQYPADNIRVTADYDAFIGADGAGSSFREHDPLMQDGGENPVFRVINVGNWPNAPKEAAYGRLKDHALPYIAFVLKGAGINCGRQVSRIPVGQYAAGADELFTKPSAADGALDMGGENVCMFEVPLRPIAGASLLTTFGAQCSWNFNVDSETPVPQAQTAAETKKLRLAFRIFNMMWTSTNAGNVDAADAVSAVAHKDANLAIFKANVKEIKVYQVGFRTSCYVVHENCNPQVGLLHADGPLAGKLALLVGDAAREAFPDGGMGANDGHHTALMAINIARTMHSHPDEVAGKIAELLQRVVDVSTALIRKAVDEHNYDAGQMGTNAANDVIFAARTRRGAATVLTQPLTFVAPAAHGNPVQVHYPQGP